MAELNNRKGSLASGQGKVLEENVISTFSRKGFEVVMWSEWNRNRGSYGEELLLKNVPFKNIYGHDGYTEFLLKSEKYNLEIRIECKWQQSAGSSVQGAGSGRRSALACCCSCTKAAAAELRHGCGAR